MVIVEKMPLNEGLRGFAIKKYPNSNKLIYGYLDINDRIIIEAKYDCIWNFINGLAKVKLGSRWGFINKKDSPVIPIIYDSIENLGYHDMVKVCLNNQWGFVDWQNQIIIETMYDWISNFQCGLAVIKSSGKYGAIDFNNVLKIPLIFDHINPFTENYAQAKYNGETVRIDIEGNIVIK